MSRDAGPYLAWLAALAATPGALSIGEVLGRDPCHLCWACRAFHPILQGIREEFPTEVRIVLRHAAFHAGSDEAIGPAEAGRRGCPERRCG